tara:strand:+ start:264 stop:446 length:183 start_codon:yes stop_codon:yes gene_type:complete
MELADALSINQDVVWYALVNVRSDATGLAILDVMVVLKVPMCTPTFDFSVHVVKCLLGMY